MSSAKTSDKTFSARLIAWQASDGRHDLPWQNTQDAYRIWLSEIMLQQTQVATVIPYYQRFLARFPNVKALAEAPLEAVLESWAGLGYYARARNLHRSAQIVASEYDGIFPHLARQIEQLPGVGDWRVCLCQPRRDSRRQRKACADALLCRARIVERCAEHKSAVATRRILITRNANRRLYARFNGSGRYFVHAPKATLPDLPDARYLHRLPRRPTKSLRAQHA